MRQAAFFLSIAFVVCSSACSEVAYRANQDHCALNEGDRYCAELFPERPYCAQGQGDCALGDRFGCVAEVSAECHATCGELNADECSVAEGSETETESSSESGSSTESSGSGDSSTTTGPMPCVSDEECTEAEALFCGVTGECGTCSGTTDPDAACAGVDPGLPLCVGDTCVACTAENPAACTGATPICDGATNTCVPCIEHDQCGGAACNLYTGACLPADRVFEVGGATPDFPSLSMAVTSLEADTESTLIVHPGMPSYDEAVTVDGGRVVAFLAAEIGPGVAPPGWIQSSAGVGPQLTATAGTTVLLDGLRLSGNADGLGLHVDGGQAWVDRSRIVQNSGGGVLAENGAELTLRNCFVGGPIDGDAVVVDSASLSQSYTTIGAGPVAVGRTRALFCQNELVVNVENSILLSLDDDPEIECAAAVLTNDATEADVGFNAAWFANYVTGDFSLSPTGTTTFADIAQWSTGDPLTDIDGDPRPGVDGTPDYAGADVPQ